MAVCCRPSEPLGMVLRRTNHQIGIADVVRQKIKAHQAVRARRNASVLHTVIVGSECFSSNEEISDNRHKISTHGFLLFCLVLFTSYNIQLNTPTNKKTRAGIG